jgi:ubiquinone/menaquinone biosynthesis C-methylase UbiE
MSPRGVDDLGSRSVPYERQTLKHPNPVARFAHRARYRRSLSLAGRHVPEGGTILDFGAGTGELLHQLGAARPNVRLLAFEPFMTVGFSEVRCLRNLEVVPDGSVDAVTAFEVCEHLGASQIDDFLTEVLRLLRPEGCLIVSVPVMEGVALPIKEASRALLFRRPSDYGAADLVRGLLGRPVPRAADIRSSHKGFAHRALWTRLERDFQTISTVLSPFPSLPWWVNSQKFGVLRPRNP